MTRQVKRTKLLVSVRDAEEAAVALAAGVDLIDVKEPAGGSLGAADEATIRAVVETIAGRAPVSAAYGELIDWDDGVVGRIGNPSALDLDVSQDGRIANPSYGSGLNFAKIGLAGCREVSDWRARWRRWAAGLPGDTKPVAVAYADAEAADAPDFADVVALASETRAPYLLVDTYDKKNGTLLDHWPPRELAERVAFARAANLGIVLAGSLIPALLADILPLLPDYIAVRGAACAGDRQGRVDAKKVGELVGMLARFQANY